jgi:hypothetical protein
MSKYHINDKGNAGQCSAKAGGCPFGGKNNHYSTAADARKAYEQVMASGGQWTIQQDPPKPKAVVPAVEEEKSVRSTREAGRIDYDRMKRVYPKQKAALTRAINSNDSEKIVATCKDAIREWDEIGSWPDEWSRWERALSDSLPWSHPMAVDGMNQLARQVRMLED